MTNWMDNKHFCNSLLLHTPVFSGKNDQSIHRGQRSQLASAKSGEAESENGLYSLRKKKKVWQCLCWETDGQWMEWSTLFPNNPCC